MRRARDKLESAPLSVLLWGHLDLSQEVLERWQESSDTRDRSCLPQELFGAADLTCPATPGLQATVTPCLGDSLSRLSFLL